MVMAIMVLILVAAVVVLEEEIVMERIQAEMVLVVKLLSPGAL